MSPRTRRGVALFFGLGVTFKIFKRVCVARGLATGQTVALVLERSPEGPLRGALEDHGGGVWGGKEVGACIVVFTHQDGRFFIF